MKKTNGSGLVFAVVLMFVILAMVVTLSSVTVLETKMNQKTKSSVGAFYNSESGVEWALNQIATKSGTINSVFTGVTAVDPTTGKINCPDFGSGSPCSLYLLDSNGKVINNSNPDVNPATGDISLVKAVRSVGTQGGETQRAIEAAVAAGGGGCYISYGKPPVKNRAATPNDNCITDFTDRGDLGDYGACQWTGGGTGVVSGEFFRPAGAQCVGGWAAIPASEAYLCCQN